MALILCIETSTNICSVALSYKGTVISFRETSKKMSHASLINTYIQEVFVETPYTLANIDAVAVSAGPGSYTGLRIGISTAKGICYALNKPLVAINSLKSLAYGFKCNTSLTLNGVYVPMIDARRMEVYAAVYNDNLQELETTKPVILTAATYDKYLFDGHVVFCGNGSAKYKTMLQHRNAYFAATTCSARNMAGLAYEKLLQQEIVDLAYFEPLYVKNFVAKKKQK